jgi:ribose transport system substrate-binding protein
VIGALHRHQSSYHRFNPMNRTHFQLLVAAALLVGCSKEDNSQPTTITGEGSSKGVIAYSTLTSNNPFFNVISANLEAEANAAGYDVQVVSGDEDAKKQSDQIKDFIAQKVAAIVLNPCDSKSIGPAIEEANRAGIPVFTCDIKCLAPQAKVVSHIATDNLQGGRMAGEAMIEALGETGGKVLVLDKREVESCLLRVAGFKEVIEKHNASATTGKIEVVAELPGAGQKIKGRETTQAAMQSYPDLAGIFAINDPSGLGAYSALEEAGKADQVKIIAFDGQPEGKRAIKDGKFYADPVQFPDRLGRETARTIIAYFNGDEVAAEQLIPTELYRKADAEKDPTL